MFEKIKAWIKRKRETAREQQAADRLIKHIKATDVKGDDTEKYVEIYPQGRAKHGNDRKGDKSKVRYATIGFVAEYGTSSHAARPYMTVANEKAHEKVVEAQRSIWESETGE